MDGDIEMAVVPVERIERSVYLIRGQKVILDRDLAVLYGVKTKVLKQTVRRNARRFPADFMFILTSEEFAHWRSQIVTSKSDRKGLRHQPMAFTEQGVAMLSGLLNSDKGGSMNKRRDKERGRQAMGGRAVIVTGGAQGIGKAIVRRFLESGAAVHFLDRDGRAGRETVKEYASLGRVGFSRVDVSDEKQVRSAISRAAAAFGGLDVLVNNAAIGFGRVPPTELATRDWNRVLGVNLTGPFLCAKYAAPHLRKRRGLIVNIASTRAMMSEANTEAYSASKGGLVALTHALAVSLGPGIRVNCISPGWIETGDWQAKAKRRKVVHSEADRLQHPCGRVGEPDDIAAMVLHLATDGGFITGANFVIDGGMTHKMIYV